jgi:hypothetical protein
VAVVNGVAGTDPVTIAAEVGKPVVLDAGRSTDPDGQKLHYSWFHYGEAGSTGANLADVTLSGTETARAVVTPTAVCRAGWLPIPRKCVGTGTAHIILAVTDEGTPRLTSYRRVILEVSGGR